MKWDRAIKWTMLVAGALTFTMITAAIDPGSMLRKNFGTTLDGPVAEIVVRNWGALIAIVGAMLVYGAFHPVVRPLVLTVAAVSKIIFIGLLLTYGRSYLGGFFGLAVIVDSIEVVLFALFLVAKPRVVAEYS